MENECIGCGLCETMCHRKAITIGEDEKGSFCKIDENLCDHCDICNKICPIEKIKVSEDMNMVRQVAVGRSKNKEVVRTSASGGIVSEILMYLFDTGEIEAAIVAFHDKQANIYGDVIESADDVKKHSGSYYHTSKQLINVQKIRNYKKVAVVGLPCHIEGIINYCRLTKQEGKVITIALFCTVGRTYKGFRKFFRMETGFDVATGNIAEYVSRYGEKKLMHIEDNEGNVYECPDELYKYRMDFFYANRSCLDCRKLYGLSADISVGDAWHRVVEKNGVKEKMAIISANSEEGDKVIKIISKELDILAVSNGKIELLSSQMYGVGLKQKHTLLNVQLLRKLPKYRKYLDVPVLSGILFKYRNQILRSVEKDSQEVIKGINSK